MSDVFNLDLMDDSREPQEGQRTRRNGVHGGIRSDAGGGQPTANRGAGLARIEAPLEGTTTPRPVRRQAPVPVADRPTPVRGAARPAGGASVRGGRQPVAAPATIQDRGAVSMPVTAPVSQVATPVPSAEKGLGVPRRVVPVSAGRAGKGGGANSGSHLTAAEKSERLVKLVDYLQQVRLAKRSDIARLYGLNTRDMPSTLRHAMPRGYVAEIKDSGLPQKVYGNTKYGNDIATYRTDGAASSRDVTPQIEHRLAVARIASVLLAPADTAIPHLWPGIENIHRSIAGGDSFLVGEPLMQASWRQLTDAKKLLTRDAQRLIAGWDGVRESEDRPECFPESARAEAWKFVIPPRVASADGSWVYANESFQNSLDSRERSFLGYHSPDLVVTDSQWQAICIEYERSPKSRAGYVDIIRKMALARATGQFRIFIWLTPSRHIQNLLQDAINECGAGAYIKACVIGTGGSPLWTLSNGIESCESGR